MLAGCWTRVPLTLLVTSCMLICLDATDGSPLIRARDDGIDDRQEPRERASEIASCVFDSFQAAGFFAQAGVLIQTAISECELPPSPGQVRACLAASAGVVAAFLEGGSFISGAVSNCDPSFPRFPALCGAEALAVTASVAEIIQGAAGLVDNCGGGGPAAPPERRLRVKSNADNATAASSTRPGIKSYSSAQDSRRLSQASGEQTREEYNSAVAIQGTANELASCIVNAIQGTLWLGRLGIIANQFDIEACHPTNTPHWREDCAASILGLLTSMSYAASFFSAVASQCPLHENLEAMCAADITQILGALFGIGSSASAMTITCEHDNLQGEYIYEDAETISTGVLRRLGEVPGNVTTTVWQSVLLNMTQRKAAAVIV